MARVVRRTITTTPQGAPIGGSTERIADDGNGRVHAIVRRSTMTCQGCRRPVTDTGELRGQCDCCGRRPLCSRCQQMCEVCGRSLCGTCLRGFVGNVRLRVCPGCLVRVQDRQHYEEQLMREQVAFERHLQAEREFSRLTALRLQAQRTQIVAEHQDARLRLAMRQAGAQTSPGLVRRAFSGMWRYGQRLLR